MRFTMRIWILPTLLAFACEPSDTTTDDKDADDSPPTDGDTDTDTDTEPDPGDDDDDDTEDPTSTDSGTVPSEPTVWDEPDSLPDAVVSASCGGYNADSWLNPTPTTPELHVFGVYQPTGTDFDSAAPILVTIDRSYAPMVIVLTSYEEVGWTVRWDPAVTTIDQVIVNGYDLQTVVFESSGVDPIVPPPVFDGSPYVNSFGVYPFATQGAYLNETLAFMGDVEVMTGLDGTSFWGCYAADGFRLQ